MVICRTLEAMRDVRRGWRSEQRAVTLIPTMGALHSGHLSLIRQAAEAGTGPRSGAGASAGPRTVVSIFVNPTQFGPEEDFDRYPRQEEQDLEMCRKEGVDAVFIPTVQEMYPRPPRFSVSIAGLNRHMCGATRPGHFEGVCQVVAKLFHAVEPDTAWFGQKDIQQLLILNRFTTEYNFPVRLRMGETVREADGLAMSSRNRYLSPEERALAPQLFTTLSELRNRVLDMRGASSDPAPGQVREVEEQAASTLRRIGFRTDYIGVYDAETLEPALHVSNGALVLAAAARLGATRLIDNLLVGAEELVGALSPTGQTGFPS